MYMVSLVDSGSVDLSGGSLDNALSVHTHTYMICVYADMIASLCIALQRSSTRIPLASWVTQGDPGSNEPMVVGMFAWGGGGG